jgi:hypothetical protein
MLKQDGKPVQGEYQNAINVPYWSETGPYPSVKLLCGTDVDDLVYRCHIVDPKDNSRIAIIHELPQQ